MLLRVLLRVLGNEYWKPGDKCCSFSSSRWTLKAHFRRLLRRSKGIKHHSAHHGVSLLACLYVGFPPSLSHFSGPSVQLWVSVCQRHHLHSKFVSGPGLKKPVLRHSIYRPLLPSEELCDFTLNSVLLLLGHY